MGTPKRQFLHITEIRHSLGLERGTRKNLGTARIYIRLPVQIFSQQRTYCAEMRSLVLDAKVYTLKHKKKEKSAIFQRQTFHITS